MKAEDFINSINADFYAGVPDSLLGPLCDCLYDSFGISKKHIVAANEGNAVALAAGHYIATGKPGVVYMQNSGIGNALNPIASLTHEKVYGIPVIYVIGWRGEPGVKDEPQHIFQGEITVELVELLGLKVMIVDSDTKPCDIGLFLKNAKGDPGKGTSVAFIVKKGSLTYDGNISRSGSGTLTRERAIEIISGSFPGSLFISTTGKASRELFEIRERRGEAHGSDFLTVGSMGHASSVALKIALDVPDRRVVLIDGDGACVMHMGSLLVNSELAPSNLLHFVINNGVHDSVGGMPTPARERSLKDIAHSCGYRNVFAVKNEKELAEAAEILGGGKDPGLSFIEVITAPGSRKDLGRPSLSARENLDAFRKYIGTDTL